MRWIFFLCLACGTALAADVCDPKSFSGAYGFGLSGQTAISGEQKPTVSVGRLVFDSGGSADGNTAQGQVTGVSSTNFAGLLLGNPHMGMFTFHADCSISWTLQDDSGNFQHFSGTLSPDLKTAQFRQTDPGAPDRGSLIKSADECKAGDFQGRYRYAISGDTVQLGTGIAGGKVTGSGTLEADGSSSVKATPDPNSWAVTGGTFQIEDGCFVHLELEGPAADSRSTQVNFRGVLVNGGKGLLGIQTDPGTAVSIRLTGS
jgi:hypothetical protein